jgi:ABC-type spermidine/putrescine transport system permease subunit II
MVLPLYSALDRMDRSLMEASLDLGAGHLRTIWSVVVPLAGRESLRAILITFIPALGAYLTPDLLGGTDSQMIANVIERQFKRANDWPFGAALSFLLMYLTFIAIAAQSLFNARGAEGLMADQGLTSVPGFGAGNKEPKEKPGTARVSAALAAAADRRRDAALPLFAADHLMVFSFNDQPPQRRVAGLHDRLVREGVQQRLAVQAFINSLTIAFSARSSPWCSARWQR